MFTLEEISEIHNRLGSMSSFPKYFEALIELGVETYNTYLTDGHSEYFGAKSYSIVSNPVHEVLVVADKSDNEAFLKHLSLHEQRKNQLHGNVPWTGGKRDR